MIAYHRVFVGSTCDNACLHCPSRDKDPSMDLSEVEKELDILPRGQNIAFTGGEPLVHNNLLSFIAAARQHGAVRIKMMTNGRRLADGDLLEALLEAGCRVYEVKLFGSQPAIHDAITKKHGSFEETVRGMANLEEASQCEAFENAVFVTARIELTQTNIEDLAPAMGLAASLGVDRILFVRRTGDFSITKGAGMVANAVKTATLNRIWSMCEGFPPCLMTGCERHLTELLEPVIHDGDKPKGCQPCCLRDLCAGPPKDYARDYGTKEFKAVTAAPYLEDVKRLAQKRKDHAEK